MNKLIVELKTISRGLTEILISDITYYVTENITPSHSFKRLSIPHSENILISTTARDSYDEKMALCILAKTTDYLSKRKTPLKNIHLISDIYPGRGREEMREFDRIAIIPPLFAESFKNESELLQKHTFMAFPCYGIELDCDLNFDQFQHRKGRKDKWRLDLPDWNRVIIIKSGLTIRCTGDGHK